MGRFRFGRNDAAYACILFFTGFLALPSKAALAEPVFHQGDDSISLAPAVDPTKKAVETDNTWWVTDENLDPASARSMDSCKDAYPDVRFLAETKPFENTGKAVAGGNKDPIVWFCREFKVEGKPLGAYAVELAQIDDRDRTYLNGALIGATGDFDAELAQAYDWARIYPVGDSQIREGSNLLLVQVRGYSLATKWGMFVDRTRFGTAQSIYSRFYALNFMAAGFLIMYFTAASYFLFLFLRRQKEREYLFFAIFTFLLVIYQFFRTQLKYEISEDFLLWKRMEYIVLFLLVPSFYYFFRAYFHMPSSRWQKLLDYGMLVPGIAELGFIGAVLSTDNAALWSHLNLPYNQLYVWPLYILASLGILIYNMIRRDRDAFYMIGGFLTLLAAALVDSLSNAGYLTIPRLAGYAFGLLVLGLGLILANRFVRVNEQVEELNANLEKKVEQRTAELQESLAQIRTLKVQQDGDYFLTSLLVNPLASINVELPTVHVESITRQKKRFQFKHRESEIGGDISIAYRIELRGKEYVAFLNADAMGKSIQGAGGAIVIGTVFKSSITRTLIDSAAKARSPERWLKDCFKELQDTFCSFDGSMLVSAVIGLIEVETGFVLFLNAEHPWTVLYRNGQATFLEEELMLRKLGVDGFDNGFYLRQFQMEPGDVLIMGSDGRDDVLLSEGSGTDRINEDHTLFLQHVQNGNSDLERVAEEIEKAGKLTDDLSLLRLGFMEDPPSQLIRPAKERSEQAQEMIEEAEKQMERDPERAIVLARKAVDVYPSGDDILYQASRIIKKCAGKARSHLKVARDFSERLRIRSPRFIANLNHLARLCFILGDIDRAEKLAGEVVALDMHNEKANRLLRKIKDFEESRNSTARAG